MIEIFIIGAIILFIFFYNGVINSSKLKNLDLDIGAGKATIEAYLEGRNDIDCGVGALDINLLGNKEDYQIKVNKGIGSVTVDGIKQMFDKK